MSAIISTLQASTKPLSIFMTELEKLYEMNLVRKYWWFYSMYFFIDLNTISAKIYEVDIILREFGLLNENGSICSIFKQIHNPLYPDEIPYRSDNYEVK